MSHEDALVVVTGAAGFVASHIVEQLLGKGYRVRGTARDPASSSCAHLKRLPFAAERLELVAAELLDGDAWPRVLQGVSVVMHTASPYSLDVKDAQRDLVDPALHGTRNVLNAAAATPSVKRVVLTSSMAAITDEPDSERTLTEGDWNELSSLTRNPYYYSKTVAEREAWGLAERQQGYSLVVINPFLVIGPSHSSALNTSNQLFADLLNGTYPGIMRLVWGFVDVRDVARAHVEAMERSGASGRYICAAGTMGMRDVVSLLRECGYDGYALPKLGLDCAVGDYAVRLSSYFQPKGVGSYLRTHVGRVPQFDNVKIKRELGIEFRPLEESIRDTVLDVIRHGHVKQG
jgi:dihydroflavonol-4-reductase